MQRKKIKPIAFEWLAGESKLMEDSSEFNDITEEVNEKIENLVNPAKFRNYYIPNINPDPYRNTIHHNMFIHDHLQISLDIR
jgi:hypothetical protein